jgi:hypothetical protein
MASCLDGEYGVHVGIAQHGFAARPHQGGHGLG